VAAVLAGGALVLCALPSRGALRMALAMAGAGLATRGATNVPLSRLARPMRRARANGEREHSRTMMHERLQNSPESMAASVALH
jgi:uncharacterized membrane protein